MLTINPESDLSRPSREWFVKNDSGSVLWIEEMNSHKLIGIITRAGIRHVPVTVGMRIAICIFNGHQRTYAYPTFIGDRNIWSEGSCRPEECQAIHMWAVRSGRRVIMHEFKKPGSLRQNQLVVADAGDHLTIGNGTLDSIEHRGLIRVYEREEIQPATAPDHEPRKVIFDPNARLFATLQIVDRQWLANLLGEHGPHQWTTYVAGGEWWTSDDMAPRSPGELGY